jgi:ADP-ribose pyrophosphatase YjhB (NUDIX family)
MAESDRDERARALMLLPRGREKWGLPGGGIEGRETVEEAAVREVREETGVECDLEDCWLVRRIRTVAEGRDPELHWLQAFFDAEYAGGRIEIQQGEANGAAWFAVPPTRMLPANERRAQRFF